MAKILFLLDYPRLNYFINGKPDYGKTKTGKNLLQDLRKLKLKEHRDFEFWYTYPEVPEPERTNRRGEVVKYKAPTKSQLDAKADLVKEAIRKYAPDVIVPMGTLTTRFFGLGGIIKAQGIATQATIEGKETWLLPVFSQEYIETYPNHKPNRNLALQLLSKYLTSGDSALRPERPEYFEVTSIEQARDVFAKPVQTGECAWDTETNTLYPNRRGAKVLVISFSWQEGKACAIPVGHDERYSETGTALMGDKSYFTKDEVKEIFAMLVDLLRAKTVGDIHTKVKVDNPLPPDTPLVKVGHNMTYDEHFLLATHHAHELDYVNVVDTLMGHFLEVSQDSDGGSSRRLSDLAFSLTPLGGYDEPLEDYKKWLMNEVLKKSISYIKKLARKEKNPDLKLSRDNLGGLLELIDWSYLDKNHFRTKRIEDWVIDYVMIPITNRFKNESKIEATMDLATISNSTDFNGDKFSYEWIPMEIMYYYASGDADATLRVHHALLNMIEKDPLNADGKIKNLYLNFYPKLVASLAAVQNHGMQVDDNYLKAITKTYAEKTKELNGQIRELPAVKDFEASQLALYQQGLEEWKKPPKERDKEKAKFRDKFKDEKYLFSASRSKDIATILYKNLGYTLPYSKDFIKDGPWKKHKPEGDITWEDYKTNKFALDYVNGLAKKNDDEDTQKLTEMLLKFSIVNKISSSFTDSLRQYMDNDLRLHGHFLASGTSTGRLASNQINLQNIPAAKSNTHLFNYKYPIKRMFVSRFHKGRLINIDYSSLEFHILALVTNEDSMTKAFLAGQDIHKANASLMYNTPYDEVTKTQRKDSKAIGLTSL